MERSVEETLLDVARSKKPSPSFIRYWSWEMKRVAGTQDDPIVEIPLVVRLRPVVVEVERSIVIALHVEHVRIAVPIGMYDTPPISLSLRFEFSRRCIVFGISNALAHRTKYLLFLNFYIHSVFNRNRKRSRIWSSGFGSRKP